MKKRQTVRCLVWIFVCYISNLHRYHKSAFMMHMMIGKAHILEDNYLVLFYT